MTTTATTRTAATTLTLQDLERTVEKLRGIPPSKWMLVAPDGRAWTGDDPMLLAAQAKVGLWFDPFDAARKGEA